MTFKTNKLNALNSGHCSHCKIHMTSCGKVNVNISNALFTFKQNNISNYVKKFYFDTYHSRSGSNITLSYNTSQLKIMLISMLPEDI